MSKGEFIQSVNAPESVAEKAWESADGDEARARELLKDENIWFKGSFTSSGDPVCGFFIVGFSPDDQSAHTVKGVVLNSDDEDDLQPNMDRERYLKNLEHLSTSGNQMNANTEQLVDVLSEHWRDNGSSIRQAVATGDFDSLGSIHTDLFSGEFDFKIADTRIEAELERAVDSEPASSETESEEEETELPCDVEITPVKGVPVSKMSPGDALFVEIGDVGPGDRNTKRRLEATGDAETGMVPADLVSKESSDAGTMNLRVQFAQNVYGKVACGKDVSIRVPEETLDRYGAPEDDETIEFLKEHWIAVATGVIGSILFISLIMVLIGLI